jgi:hypothetical protein
LPHFDVTIYRWIRTLTAPPLDWFLLSEKEQRLLATEVGELQRRLPFWVVRRLFCGVPFDNFYDLNAAMYQPSSSSSSSSSIACMWACECEDADGVLFNLHDDDDWFRSAVVKYLFA